MSALASRLLLPLEPEPRSASAMREYHALLRSTSRTFAVGIEALPQPLRDSVTLAYLVLRVSDYFEDSPTLSPDEKRSSLDEWADLLQDRGSSTDAAHLARLAAPEDRDLPDYRAVREAQHIFEGLLRIPAPLREVIREHTAATTRGMARWALRGDDFPDEGTLDDYMFEVAGRVGLLLTDLFASHDPRVRTRKEELREVAVSFGLGLQTVNILRGLHEDPERGWNYVPRSLLPAGQDRVDLRTLPQDLQLGILEFLVAKAGRHVADAFHYCELLPRRARGLRIFCTVPALIASRTAEASRANTAVFLGPVKVARGTVGRLVLGSRIGFFSNSWLRAERRRALDLAHPDR